jgi:hypothetical protein
MPVVLDTRQFPVGERAEAFSSALNTATFPAHADLHLDVPKPSARIQRWVLGPGIDVVLAVTTGHTLRRTARQVRKGSVDQLSLALALSGSSAGWIPPPAALFTPLPSGVRRDPQRVAPHPQPSPSEISLTGRSRDSASGRQPATVSLIASL